MAVVLVVDDGLANRELVQAYLSGLDCEVRLASDGASALEQIQQEPPDLVLLDVQMPGMDGYEVCRRIKAGPGGRLLPVVMITLFRSKTEGIDDRARALEAGADDFLSKPVGRAELVARVRLAQRLKALFNSLDSAEQVIFSLAATVAAKDAPYVKHTQRVAESARHLGARLGLPEVARDALYRGGLIHDIGNIDVPDVILLKPGRLDAIEAARMQSHVVTGEKIISPLRSLSTLLPIVRHHHERCVRRARQRSPIPSAAPDRSCPGRADRWRRAPVGPRGRRPFRGRDARAPAPRRRLNPPIEVRNLPPQM